MSGKSIAERMRERRETWFQVGDVSFLIRRPRSLDIAQAYRDGGQSEVAIRSVVGWRGMRLCDLLPGELDTEVEFSQDAFREWIGDRVDVLTEIANEVARLIEVEAERAGEASKN
jgi:hypothetical protein